MSGRDAERFLTKSFEVLPSSMCPSQWVRVVDWPLSETGKLDISYLVDRYKQNESTFIEPASELESDILKAFESVAGVTPLSVVDNYFDVGGDSLSVLRLIGLLDHKGISISLADVYAYPTSRALAAFVSLTNH
jgi:aryl carrier-like protein